MILADKIIENRKKNGWSQEELAERLGVSRQSVSKWEGAQSVPDMKKIVQLSEIFGVSTDYLIKDEITEPSPSETAPVEDDIEETVRKVSMEEAAAFLTHNEHAARWISTGVLLCIISPVLLILLAGFAQAGFIPANEEIAEIAGTVILLIIVASAVGIFLREGFRGKKFEYLEEMNIDTEYGVDGMVRERMDSYAERHSRLLIIGIMLCVISAIPLLLLTMIRDHSHSDLPSVIGLAILLIMIAAGVKMIVLTCIRQGGFDRLLEQGDYTRINKRAGKYDGIYWAVATAIYLAWSFLGNRWDITWMVWPVAGVLFVGYHEIVKALIRSR